MKFIFLTYINRSGSTFLANLLSRYKEILVCPEAEVLLNKIVNKSNSIIINNKFFSHLRKDKKLVAWKLDFTKSYFNNVKSNFDIFLQIIQQYRENTKPKASIIVFKATESLKTYSILTEEIKNQYQIQFISLIRDPRAIFASQRKTISDLTMKQINTNPLITSYQWDYFVRKSLQYSANHNFTIIKYEDLIKNPEKEITLLISRLGLKGKIHQTLTNGDLFKRIPVNQKSMHLKINQPPDITRINHWKKELPEVIVYIIESISKQAMQTLNYQLQCPEVKRIIVLLLKIYYKILILLKISSY